MCIAILNAKGIIPDAHLKESWDTNKDGAGFAYVDKRRKIQIYKTLTDYPEFLREYKKAKAENPKSNFLVHFRIATQGGVNIENCHPFLVNDSLAMIHNGMLRNTPVLPLRSDTNFLAHTILGKMGKGIEYDPEFKHICEVFTSTFGNKLVFLNTKNDYFIVNEAAGHWLDGNWYSNNSYKTYEYDARSNYNVQEQQTCIDCHIPFYGVRNSEKKCFTCRSVDAVQTKVAHFPCDICNTKTNRPYNVEYGGRFCEECYVDILEYV